MSLTDAIREAYADPDLDDQLIHTLQLDHPSFDAPVRIVANSDEDMTLRLSNDTAGTALFKACPVNIVLQGYDDDGPTEGMMRIDNVSKILQPGLEAAVQAGQALTLVYRGYVMTALSEVGDYRGGMFVQRVSLFPTFATGTITAATKADRQAFPLITYDVAKYKALHGLF